MERFVCHIAPFLALLVFSHPSFAVGETEQRIDVPVNTVWRVCRSGLLTQHRGSLQHAGLQWLGQVVRPSGLVRFGARADDEVWQVHHQGSQTSTWIPRAALCDTGIRPVDAILVDTLANELHLVRGNVVQQSFPVGTGRVRDGYETPQGLFRVRKKERCPLYYGDHPEQPISGCSPANPLGQAALWFEGRTYGIHGTDRPDLISGVSTDANDRRVSKGCLRLNNNHVNWLFNRAQHGAPLWIFHGLSGSRRGGDFRVMGNRGKSSLLMVRLEPGVQELLLEQRSTGARFRIGGGDLTRIRLFAYELPVGSFRGEKGYRVHYLRPDVRGTQKELAAH